MRWNYLVKSLLKSVIVLCAITIVAFSLLNRGDVDNGDGGLLVFSSPLPPLPFEELTQDPQIQTQSQAKGTRIISKLPGIVSDGADSAEQNLDKSQDNGPYYDVNNIDDAEEDPSSDHAKNARYHLRFWDLINSTKSADHVLSTGPLFKDGKQLDYLWRPDKKVEELTPDSYSLVPQIVWEMEAPNSSFAKDFETKTIVLWDGFRWWNKPSWKDPKQLISTDCEIAPNSLTKCQFSERTDSYYLDSVHAVIAARDAFHTGSVQVPDHVLKFYFMLESPFHSWALLNRSEDLIASYWRGSDVVTPYAKWVSYDLKRKYAKQAKNYAEGKTKTAAAFISNCDAWNDRMGFINELRKHIQVDVFGACGEKKCSRFGSEDCNGMLKKDYYFYMSFENSNCRDYVTEKLYTNGLTNDILPIVMGAHPEDYQALAPYKSYIHVEEFDSPKELAAYLHYLIENPAEYNKYFEWKGTGEFVSAAFFCQMCAMVHYADLVPPPKRTEPYRWGHLGAIDDGMCLPKGRWYWTRDNNSKVSKSKLKNKKPKQSGKRNHHASLINIDDVDASVKVVDVADKLGVNDLYDG